MSSIPLCPAISSWFLPGLFNFSFHVRGVFALLETSDFAQSFCPEPRAIRSHRSELPRRAARPTSLIPHHSGLLLGSVLLLAWGVLLCRLLLSGFHLFSISQFRFSTWVRWECPGRPLSPSDDGGSGGQVGGPAPPCVDAAGEQGLVTQRLLPES